MHCPTFLRLTSPSTPAISTKISSGLKSNAATPPPSSSNHGSRHPRDDAAVPVSSPRSAVSSVVPLPHLRARALLRSYANTSSREEDSYWCILEHSATKKKEKKPKPQANEDDDLGPKLRSHSVGLGPCSGLTVTVNYEEPRFYSSYRNGGSRSVYKYASIRYECAVSDPFDARRRPMEFADGVIRCGDKYYAVSLQGAVAEMEMIDTRLRITAVGSMRAVPSSRSSSRLFKEYLVEMEGEILLVYLIHHESVEAVDDVEVFRLDFDKLDLIKVES